MNAPAPGAGPGGRPLSFSFDDGPDPQWTPRVLAELGRCGIRASFFMVGERVLARPSLARDVIAAGHDVELHCHRHVRHTELSESELMHDTTTALEALASTGAEPRLWRPPWGVMTEAGRAVAQRLGLTLVRWSIDTHDWRGDPPQEMLAAARERLDSGGAVLMHDGLGPGAERSGCENTLALLPALTVAARARGLRIVPMSSCRRGRAASTQRPEEVAA